MSSSTSSTMIAALTVTLLVLPSLTAVFSLSTTMTKPKSSNIQLSWEPDAAMSILDGITTSYQPNRPYMVALVGIPGSGKSTSAEIMGKLLDQNGISSTIIPFDGYHIPIDDLKKLPNADDAIYRRGAPDTFDPSSLKRDLLRMKLGQEQCIKVPGFDHARGDPDYDLHSFVRNQHTVVICEGLYLLHDEDGWDLNECFDHSIFIDSDVDMSMDRLKIRNKVIPGYTPEEIELRVDAVDRVNAQTVKRSKDRADLIVQSAQWE